MLTNTHSVGVVRDAVIAWRVRQGAPTPAATGGRCRWWPRPGTGTSTTSTASTSMPRTPRSALDQARGGPVAEGNVGGGTGMICHEFKCGIGTASRRISEAGNDYTVGVLVQANYGLRDSLRIAGVPVGQELRNDRIYSEPDPEADETGSIIIVVATDAPLLPHQLKRVARRAGMGLARMGSYSGNGSGDIFIAFSTANTRRSQGQAAWARPTSSATTTSTPLFEATVQATEEAIVNAMVAARDMTGRGRALRQGAAARRTGRPAQEVQPLFRPALIAAFNTSGTGRTRPGCVRAGRAGNWAPPSRGARRDTAPAASAHSANAMPGTSARSHGRAR